MRVLSLVLQFTSTKANLFINKDLSFCGLSLSFCVLCLSSELLFKHVNGCKGNDAQDLQSKDSGKHVEIGLRTMALTDFIHPYVQWKESYNLQGYVVFSRLKQMCHPQDPRFAGSNPIEVDGLGSIKACIKYESK